MMLQDLREADWETDVVLSKQSSWNDEEQVDISKKEIEKRGKGAYEQYRLRSGGRGGGGKLRSASDALASWHQHFPSLAARTEIVVEVIDCVGSKSEATTSMSSLSYLKHIYDL